MSDFDPLEVELAALRPREPSADLMRRIASRLAEASLPRKKEHSSSWRGGALVGGLLAASVAAVLAWQGGNPRIAPQPDTAADFDIIVDFDESLPSLWSYRAATLQSPEPLNALLDKYADRSVVTKSGVAPAFVFARSNFTSDSWLGEL